MHCIRRIDKRHLLSPLFTRELDVKKPLHFIILLLAFGQANAELDFKRLGHGFDANPQADLSISQSSGMSLSQAVESVRRRGNVERIVSAETKVEGGRETHYIRYMTKDGKVRTAKVPGRRR